MEVLFLSVVILLIGVVIFLVYDRFRAGSQSGKTESDMLREDMARRMEDMH